MELALRMLLSKLKGITYLFADRQISSGNLDVTVKYMGVSVFSKSGPLCDALACPLAEGPAELVFNEQMPSAAPPVRAYFP